MHLQMERDKPVRQANPQRFFTTAILSRCLGIVSLMSVAGCNSFNTDSLNAELFCKPMGSGGGSSTAQLSFDFYSGASLSEREIAIYINETGKTSDGDPIMGATIPPEAGSSLKGYANQLVSEDGSYHNLSESDSVEVKVYASSRYNQFGLLGSYIPRMKRLILNRVVPIICPKENN